MRTHPRRPRVWATALVMVTGCGAGGVTAPKAPAPEAHVPARSTMFADDVSFLRKHGDILLLESPDGGRVAVSPKYQGRVMTSATTRDGASLGWVHRAFIASGKTGTPFDNYGGEDRFWLGPEGGQYGLYFPRGKPFTLDAWQTPAAFQEGAWSVTAQSPTRVAMTHAFDVTNYAGSAFHVNVAREVRVLSAEAVAKHLGTRPPEGASWVAFETVNTVTNTGAEPWTEENGLVSIWILGMFAPAPDAKVIVPFDPRGEGPIVNDRYFGEVPKARLAALPNQSALVFTCDGSYRSKIGLSATRATPVAGSYSPGSRLLTIVHYDKPAGATRYVNSLWERQKDPYGGDVLNSYNDGPLAPGKPSLGGFYELETSSPAAALEPGQSLTHTHRTFHFVGDTRALDTISKKVLGVSVESLELRR